MKKTVWIGVVIGLCALLCGGGYWQYRLLQPQTKQYRILACMSTWARPIFASAQVLRLLRQSYPVDISVSIKGVPQNFVDKALRKEWAPEIASGRVRVRVDKNRDQYSNLLDTVRDIDIEKYDFFCKIDDDDWYGPDYFLHVNEWLNERNNIAISLTQNNMIISRDEEGVDVWRNNSDFSGPSMCFSRELILLALELEQDMEKAEYLVPEAPLRDYRHKHEDNFLHKLAKLVGIIQIRNTPVWDLAFGWQYRSVLRPDL